MDQYNLKGKNTYKGDDNEVGMMGTRFQQKRRYGVMKHLRHKAILKRFEEGRQIHFRYHYLNKEKLRFLDALLLKLLANHNLLFFIDSLGAIIHELITNAYKANLKRLYFDTTQLKMTNSGEYEEGIRKFRKEVFRNIDSFNDRLKDKNLYVRLNIQKIDGSIQFEIVNNLSLSQPEQERIAARMEHAERCHGFIESYNDFYDETEGAGLGIHMVYFLLRNSGIDPSVFRIFSENGSTKAIFSVPFQLRHHEVTTTIKEQILEEVQLLPTLPSKVTDLITLCKDPESRLTDIADRIMGDPSLTADVLKLANSANVSSDKKIDTVKDAMKRIGKSNLEELLLTAGAKKILMQRYAAFVDVWNHCQKTAIYASYLAGRYRMKKLSGHVYMSGLLHDLGKIILLSISKNITDKIADILSDKAIQATTLVEEISIGISHSTIGAIMTKKWHFPDYLIDIIDNHHSPLNVPDHLRDQTFITYLANMLCGIEDNHYKYAYLDEDVLQRFGVHDEEDLEKLLKECQEYWRGL